MRFKKSSLPLATKSAKGRSVALSAELLTNMYAEQAAEGSRNPVALVGCPGLESFSPISDDLIRGVHFATVNSTLWVVSGLKLYKAYENGSFEQIGNIGGYGRVSMADNGVEMVITTEAITYVVNLSTDALNPVTDSDFPNADTVAFLGGYFFFNNNQSGTSAQLFWSEIYDGSDYDALDFATAENTPDNLVSVWRDHDRLLLFGDRSIESWFLTGGTEIVAPYKGSVINRGLGARWSVANVDNSVIFLDERGIVRRIGGQGGYSAERISTHAIEYEISKGSWRHDDAAAYDGAVASTYIEEGHEFYIMTIPGSVSFTYDAATGLWHKRKSRGLETYRASFHVDAFNSIVCGDTETGTLHRQALSIYDEDGEEIVAEVQFPQITSGNERFRIHEIELIAETGPEGYYSSRAIGDSFALNAWEEVTDGFDENFREVGYGNGVFLLTGGVGGTTELLLRSTDSGLTWTEIASGFSSNEAIYDAFYDSLYNRWCISGEGAKIGVSSDGGLTFTTTVQGSGDRWIGGQTNGTGTWVVAGAPGRIRRSTDGGATWSNVTSGTSETLTQSFYANSKWFVVGAAGVVLVSTDDGASFSAHTAAQTALGGVGGKSVEARGNTWIIVANSGVMIRSADNGVTWTSISNPFGTSDFQEVGYGLDVWVTVSENGKIGYSADDGLTWTLFSDTPFTGSSTISALSYGDGAYITAATDGIVARLDATQIVTNTGRSPYSDTPYVMLDSIGYGGREPDVTQPWRSLGTEGDHTRRLVWRRLGQHRSYTPRMTISAPVKRVFISATARITQDG